MSAQYDATKVGQQAETLGGVHTAAGLAKLYANNPPGIGVPAGSTAYASDLGPAMFDGTTWINASGALALSTSASAATANTALINAALARGGQVSITAPGTYYVTASQSVSFNGNTYQVCLSIPSDTRFVLGQGVILKIADGLTNPVLIQNSNPTAGSYTGNSNIVIEGGQWNGNRANSTRSDGACMCAFMMWFTGVTNLRIDNVWLADSIAYHSFFSSIDTLRMTNIRCYDSAIAINMDGIHLHGNIRNAIIRNVTGNTGDDLIAVLPHDTAHSYTLPLDSGPIADLLIDGVIGDETAGARHLLDIVDFAAYPISNLIVRNVHGYYTDGGVYIDAVSGVKKGLLIDGVDAQPLAGSNPTYAQIAIGGGGDSIIIKNVHRYMADSVETGAKIPPIDFRSGTFSHVKIDSFSVQDATAAGAGIGFIKIESGATVSEMSVSNFSGGSTVASNSFVWNAGTLDALHMVNGNCVRINQILFTAGNITKDVSISNYRADNIAAAHILTSGAFTFPRLALTGCYINETSTSASGIIRFSGTTGTPLVQLYGNYLNNNGTSTLLTRAGSETIRVQTVDAPIVVGTLTPATGDKVVDSVSGTLVTYNGAAWMYDETAVQAPAFAATVTPVFVVGTSGSGNLYNIAALTGAITIANPASVPPSGAKVTVNLVQDATGGRAVSWGTAYQFPTAAWTNTGNTSSTRSSMTFVSDGTNLWAQGANAWH